jgi:hypothetical protein
VRKATDDVAAMKRVVVDKKAADATVVKKAADDATAAERAAVDKRATEAATTKKATDDVAVEERATTEAATRSVVESFPTPVVGDMRAAVSGGSTPPVKWPFHGSWKPRYA